MFTLNLKSGGSVAVATVAKGTTLQSLIASQVTASGREVSSPSVLNSVCVYVRACVRALQIICLCTFCMFTNLLTIFNLQGLSVFIDSL